jgi:hypothetical protein
VSLTDLQKALGHARLDTKRATLILPVDLSSALSSHARFFVLFMTDSPTTGRALGPADILPNDWSPDVREAFFDLPLDAQIEALGFVTAVQHELIHYLDLLTTPFGVNLHTKGVLEYLAFEAMVPDLLEKPTLTLKNPLVDYLSETFEVGWLLDNRDADLSSAVARGQALAGKVAFDDYTSGAPPRRVKPGWGTAAATGTAFTIKGQTYEAVTVNGVWPTLRDTAMDDYFGPFELLEGRALTLVLRYLRHLLGDAPGREKILLRYIGTFYPQTHRRYRRLLEIISGESLEDVLTMHTPPEVDNLLMLAQGLSWYALHGPPPLSEEHVASALPTLRFVVGLRAWEESDEMDFASMVKFLNAVDRAPFCIKLGFVDADESLSISLQALSLISGYLESITRKGIREHFQSIFSCQEEVMRARIGHGYASWYGNPEHGNPVEGLDDTLACALERMGEERAEFSAWLSVRGSVLYEHMPMASRAAALQSWWPNDRDTSKFGEQGSGRIGTIDLGGPA